MEHKEELSKYPSLFEPGPTLHRQVLKTTTVPDTSLYDDTTTPALQLKPTSIETQKVITIFGYSPSQLEPTIAKFREYGSISDINYGKNWMDIKYANDKSVFKALSNNCKIINGEMIGVVQKSRREVPLTFGREEVFIKRESGVIGRVIKYLFGV